MLSAPRRRVIPASLLATGALSVGLMGTALPAQAAPTSTISTASVVRAATVTPTITRTAATATLARPAATRVAAVSRSAGLSRAAVARAAAARALIVRASAVHVARTKLGARYVAGWAGPNRFDCSGLALYVVKRATGRVLPHYSRAQFAATHRVAKKNLRPGDLVFFFRYGAHHVGIYIGHGRMISATNPRGGVKIDSVFTGWYGKRYSGAGRLV